MYKGRKETTHEGIGERKTYININKDISTMYVYKWLQDLMYNNSVSKKRKKIKRYILSSLHPSKSINTPPNKNGLILTLSLR